MENDLIYLPTYTDECVEIIDSNTIRKYDDLSSSPITYTDYFIHSHYMQKSGSTNEIPIECVDPSLLTTEPMYRQDIFEIIFIGLAIIFVGYFFISKLIKVIFLGWRWS